MFSKLGPGLCWLGEKMAMAASWPGHKVSGALTTISPAVAHFNPVLGERLASARMIFKGVSALGDAMKSIMRSGDFNPQVTRRTVDGIRKVAGAVRSAYSAIRGPGSPLERGR